MKISYLILITLLEKISKYFNYILTEYMTNVVKHIYIYTHIYIYQFFVDSL